MSEEMQMIIFDLSSEEFGIEITQAHEIVKMQDITELPQSSVFIEGIINLRGEIITIIDLRKRFNLEADVDKDTRIIIADIENNKAGLIVDSISEVLRISSDDISEAPSRVAGIEKDYLQGIGKIDERLIILLNLDRLLSTDELLELEQLDEEEVSL